MADELTKLESPIDVMYLIHKALRNDALQVQRTSYRLGPGDSLAPLRGSFGFWSSQLKYHAAVEDRHMTAPFIDSPQAREMEQEHQRLEELLKDVRYSLDEEIGTQVLTMKAQRSLFGRVVAARSAQDDHLEEEEAFFLPLVRAQMSDSGQLDLARRLLIDESATNPRWVIDWVGPACTPAERDLLAELELRFEPQGLDIPRIQDPIDVMYLIHKALRAEAFQIQKMIFRLAEGDSLQPFRGAFNVWASALQYHAFIEDEMLTPELNDPAVAKQNEWQHRVLENRLEDVLACLNEEIGRTSVVPRTQRHLFGAVAALKNTQEDHIEEEEEHVLPLARRDLSPEQQVDIAKGLLMDEGAENPRWILEWMHETLGPRERESLGEIEGRITGTVSP